MIQILLFFFHVYINNDSVQITVEQSEFIWQTIFWKKYFFGDLRLCHYLDGFYNETPDLVL